MRLDPALTREFRERLLALHVDEVRELIPGEDDGP